MFFGSNKCLQTHLKEKREFRFGLHLILKLYLQQCHKNICKIDDLITPKNATINWGAGVSESSQGALKMCRATYSIYRPKMLKLLHKVCSCMLQEGGRGEGISPWLYEPAFFGKPLLAKARRNELDHSRYGF